jgi:hypothetical protein
MPIKPSKKTDFAWKVGVWKYLQSCVTIQQDSLLVKFLKAKFIFNGGFDEQEK